ncbi:hypothetical protein N7456_010659 [Penicillium angulare]|uniref:Uncharacterized protein n=1 Tax=Penicillium angulare TaxID=116970 RepID=A0A9W9K6C7_9EURO|nr:hypothetical protein N7456_010659 [Penicillium angulare]
MCTVFETTDNAFWQRDNFNWAEEVENEIENSQTSLTNPPTCSMESTQLTIYRKDQESFTEVLDSGSQTEPSKTPDELECEEKEGTWFDDSVSDSDSSSDEVLSNENSIDHSNNQSNDKLTTILEDEELDYRLNCNSDGKLQYPLAPDSLSPALAIPETMPDNTTTYTDIKALAKTMSSEFARRESCLNDSTHEFAWRESSVRDCPAIHHFNWLGAGIFQRSATLPEESLAVIVADIKVPRAFDDYRVQAILSRAYRYVDPVIVCLDDEVDSSILQLRGSELQRAAKDHCFKHYTSHGQWIFDNNEPSHQNTLDIGDIDTYLNPRLIIGNGFIKEGPLRSRADFHSIQEDTIASVSPTFPTRKSRFKRISSSLWQSHVVVPEVTVEIDSIFELDIATNASSAAEADLKTEYNPAPEDNLPPIVLEDGITSEMKLTFEPATVHSFPELYVLPIKAP